MERGRLIVFEGIDGAGTTTQSALLHETLEASFGRCLLTREPSDGPVGMLIRQVLRGRLRGGDGSGGTSPFDARSLALLFAADRLDHLYGEVVPALKAGVHVISDRYLLSSLAYQSLDMELAWIREINRLAARPDLTILLDVPAREALQRLQISRAGSELFEKPEALERVAETYRSLASHGGGRSVVTINGVGTVDAVRRAVWKAVQPNLPITANGSVP